MTQISSTSCLALRVIDLSRTGISTVPKSLSSSINLRALLLRSCRNLRMLPNLSKLQQLIVLDLSGTPLEDFPQGIKELKKLRRLDLSQTRLATFPAGVLDKLIELEELLMITNADCKGNVWGSKELGNQKQGQGPCVEELLGLEKIVLLQLSFLNGKVFDMYVNQARKRNKVPQKFRFCVGQGLQSGIAGVGENSVSIIGDPHSSTLPNTTFELHLKRCPFRKISELEVEKHCMRNLAVLGLYYITGLRYLFSGEIVKSPLMLKELRVISCKDMEEIVEPAAAEGSSATMISLPGLTKMLFSDLPQLKRIWGPKGLNCPRLDSVEVWSCPSCTELPVIYCRKRGTENPSPCKKIEIKGDSSWIQNFNNGSDASSHDPHFQFQPYPNHDFNLKFMDPAESRFTSAADYRVYMKEQQEGDKNNTMYASGFVAPQNLEEKRHGLSILIDGIKKMENRGAVLMPQLSSLIGEADALCMEVDDSLDQTSIGNRLDKLNQCTEEVQNLLLDPVKGYSQLSEVVIMGEMRTQRKEEIQEAVSDQAEGSVGTICIHGSLGVGKTAIAISIHNKALEGKLFDHVVWVDVEYGADLLKVQGAIAQSLEIMLPMNKTPDSKEERVPINASGDDIVVERAGELRNALLHMGKFLLILDSVWHPLSLNAIGIPPLVNGRKLIVTSRTRTVCDDIMNKKTFEIQPLFVGEEDEAWEIFESNIMSLPQYFLKTETVARIKEALLVELDGLPLAITKFAHNSGSHTDLDQAWRKELDKLASDPMLLDQWKYSYASLSMATRNCFLYCALFPKDYLIKRCDLIEYWRLEGLISDNNANETLAKGNHKGREALSELVNSHLLQTETGEHVKMLSNLVRSMTIYSMTKQTDLIPPHKVFIRSGCSLSKLPSEEDEECPAEVERASFMQNELQDLKLTGKMDFSRLSTLLLQDNYSLVTLNDKLFSRTPELQVLDLSQTQITTLPKSLLNLKKLCALLLRNCAKLTVLPNLSNLQQLIVLDLSGTPLLNSPKGLEKMRKLRRLDLSQTKLATFPLSVVSKLIELEELLMITAEDCVWGSSEDKLWKGPCIEDLLKLEKLAILHLHFRNKQAFDKYVNLARNYPHVLLTSRFRVGEIQRGENHEDNSPAISTLLAHSISEMFNKLNLLNLNYLDVCNLSGLSHLFSVEILKSLTQLRELRVRSCKEMVEVVQQPAQDQGEIIIISLPQLTRMLFFELPRLKSVCPGQVLHCPNLGSVQVWRCDNNLELPSILPHGDEIRIIGERTWLRNLKSDYNQAQHSDTKFIFTETDVPLEDLINTRATNGIAEETMPPELTMVGYCY